LSNLIELFQLYPAFYLGTIFILGLLVGSFLNVVIFRLPLMMENDWQHECCEFLNIDDPKYKKEKLSFNLVTPRSRCPACEHQIKALENIPVLSYLLLKGKCSHCKNKISIRYPFIELTSAITVTIVAFYFGVTLQALFAICLTWALIALSMIDFDHQLLPDDIVLPFLWGGIILNLFGIFTDIESSILGAIFGYGSLFTVAVIFKFIRNKEGMGNGDFKLLALFGAWFGWQSLPFVILMSSAVGATIGILLVIFKANSWATKIPFGPYLAIAGWISMLWGSYIMSAYLNAVM